MEITKMSDVWQNIIDEFPNENIMIGNLIGHGGTLLGKIVHGNSGRLAVRFSREAVFLLGKPFDVNRENEIGDVILDILKRELGGIQGLLSTFSLYN
jgi:hypothetical protein